MSHLGAFLRSGLNKPQEKVEIEPICTASPASPKGKKAKRVCDRFEKSLNKIIQDKPYPDKIQRGNIDFTKYYLNCLNESIETDNPKLAMHCADGASLGLHCLYSVEIAGLETDMVMYEQMHDNAESLQKASLYTNMALGGVALFGSYFVGAGFLTAELGTVGTIGTTGVLTTTATTSTTIATGAAKAGPVLSSSLYVTHRVMPKLGEWFNTISTYASNAGHRLLYGSTPLLEKLHRLYLVKEPNLNGLNQTLMTIYGSLTISNVLLHVADEPGSDIASLPLESIMGRNSAGVYGTFSISYLLGSRLFNLSPFTVIVFAIGHMISDGGTQVHSNKVSIHNLDWSRIHGGAISSLLTYGPMNWLWNGLGPWVGWKTLFPVREVLFGKKLPLPIPSFRSVTGFVTSSGILNSALFVPICLWLERGNLKNFWTGLTLREFTISIPRKTKQALVNPNSPIGVLIYHGSKVAENIFTSNHFSLFAGTGLYRQPMHDFFVKEDTGLSSFIAHCWKSLGSCRLPFCDTHKLEEDDYSLIAKDIVEGEFTQDELGRIVDYVDEILKTETKPETEMEKEQALDIYHVGLAWLAVFQEVSKTHHSDKIDTLLSTHRNKLSVIDLDQKLVDQIISIDQL